MHWHWLIIIYLFLGGLGAGAYLTSFAAEKGWLGKNSSLTRIGYYIAPFIVAIGTVLLVFDLGQGLRKPWLLIGLLSDPKSVMTWGVYILALFIVIGLIKAFLTFKNKTVPNIATIAGAILALATGAYTRSAAAVVEAVPFWATGIMPILSLFPLCPPGMSITSLLAMFIEKEKFTEGREGLAHNMVDCRRTRHCRGFHGHHVLRRRERTRVAGSLRNCLYPGFIPLYSGAILSTAHRFPLLAFIFNQFKARNCLPPKRGIIHS